MYLWFGVSGRSGLGLRGLGVLEFRVSGFKGLGGFWGVRV